VAGGRTLLRKRRAAGVPHGEAGGGREARSRAVVGHGKGGGAASRTGCVRRCQSSQMLPIHGMLAGSVDYRSVAMTAPLVELRGLNFFTVLTAGNLESISDESRLLGSIEAP
jgi:hypothetical protein